MPIAIPEGHFPSEWEHIEARGLREPVRLELVTRIGCETRPVAANLTLVRAGCVGCCTGSGVLCARDGVPCQVATTERVGDDDDNADTWRVYRCSATVQVGVRQRAHVSCGDNTLLSPAPPPPFPSASFVSPPLPSPLSRRVRLS